MLARPQVPEFEGLLEKIDRLSARELDSLPQGAIQLDTTGKVLKYNAYESKLAGIRAERVIGQHFFTEVAPCTNVQEFYGRFIEGVARKNLHVKFRYHFAFQQNPRNVIVTLYYSRLTDSVWVFVHPFEEAVSVRD